MKARMYHAWIETVENIMADAQSRIQTAKGIQYPTRVVRHPTRIVDKDVEAFSPRCWLDLGYGTFNAGLLTDLHRGLNHSSIGFVDELSQHIRWAGSYGGEDDRNLRCGKGMQLIDEVEPKAAPCSSDESRSQTVSPRDVIGAWPMRLF